MDDCVGRIRISERRDGNFSCEEFEIMKTITLTRGREALVSDEDYVYLNKFSWYASFDGRNYYAMRKIDVKHIQMHRVVMGRVKPGFQGQVDHHDGNGLNNRRLNLRAATQSQNSMNSKSKTNSSSKYKGVSWDFEKQKWKASICLNSTSSHLGYFDSEIEAARIYNHAAIRLFGEFSKLNEV